MRTIIKALSSRMGFEVKRVPRKTGPGSEVSFNIEITGQSGVGKSTLVNRFCKSSGLRFAHINTADCQISTGEFEEHAKDWHYDFLNNVFDVYRADDRGKAVKLKFIRWALKCVEVDIKYNYVEATKGYFLESGLLLFGLPALLKMDDGALSLALQDKNIIFLLSRDPEFILNNIRKRERETGRLAGNHKSKTDAEINAFVQEQSCRYFDAICQIESRTGINPLVLFTEDGVEVNVERILKYCESRYLGSAGRRAV